MSSGSMDCYDCARDGDRCELIPRIEGWIGSRWLVGVLIGYLCLLSFLVGLTSTGLWGIRQKRLAACVADIFYDGRWLLPHLCGQPRLEKPPLPYWIIAGFAHSVGQLNEWT